MVRDPWTFAAALAIGFIAWVVFANPQKSSPRLEASQFLSADPDLRLISERSEYLRTER
ncbi:hypothetical protein V1290_000235 [Bradyrhizobium sp. AZCC 1578]|uniref:hypothetical protein n=1 Tax=Bradyrhizobium sp. AZCC 1578 TaxID=3117027 RepID=UPI002FF0CA48